MMHPPKRPSRLVVGVVLSLLFFVGCTFDDAEPPELIKLHERLVMAEKELTSLEDKMKDPTVEIGSKDRYSTERELLKSRIERIHDNIESVEKRTGAHHKATEKPAESAHH